MSSTLRDINKNLYFFKNTLYALAFVGYLIFEGIPEQAFGLFLVFLCLLALNWFLSQDIQLSDSKLGIVFWITAELVLLGLIFHLSDASRYFQPMFFVIVTSIAFRFGKSSALLGSVGGWLAMVTTLLFLNESPKEILSAPDSGLQALGVLFLLAWLTGELMEKGIILEKGYKDLSNMVKTDTLTGVYQHRFFQEYLSKELGLSEKEGKNLSLVRMSIDNFQNIVDKYGYHVGEQILNTVGEIIQENIRGKDRVGRFGDEEFCVMLLSADSFDALDIAEKIRSSIRLYPMYRVTQGMVGGVTVSLGISTYPKDADNQVNLIYRANQTLYRARHAQCDRVCLSSITIDEVQNKIKRAGNALAENIPTLVALIDAKDVNTCGHSERVTKYSVAIGKELGLSEKDIERLQYGALLHDIGKINVEEHILDKPGKLSDNEYYCIQNHPTFGANFLATIDYLEVVTPLVLHHHERWDGKGYPAGIKGEEIPLGARIIAVADSFDAMISERPYKKAASVSEALEEIKACCDAQFDRRVVEAFLKVLDPNTGKILN